MMKRYVIMGNPVPLARCRNARGRMYDSQKQIKLVHGLALKQQHGNSPLFEGPLNLNITFYMPMPRTNKKIQPLHPHSFKPDLDNMLKYICDIASNGVLYEDDSLIYVINSRKVYDTIPRCEFTLVDYKENDGKV